MARADLDDFGVGPKIFLHTILLSSPLLFLCVYRPDVFRIGNGFAVWFYLVGSALIICGLAAIVISSRFIRRGFKAGELCENGPYAVSRNPIYAGWILLVIPGIAVALRAPVLLLIPVIMYLVFRRLIRHEEEYLEKAFGDHYRQYQGRVGLLIPRLGTKLPSTPE